MDRKPHILVMTPVRDIPGFTEILERVGTVAYKDDPGQEEIQGLISECDALFTNPNKSKVYLSGALMDAAKQLQVICTASTGTNHIETEAALRRGITVISLTEERQVIDRISSTAELAFGLLLAALRKIPQARDSVRQGRWDYEPFIGRQLDQLTVGVVGYGRLGTFFASYARAFGSNVLVYDPYKKIVHESLEQVERDELLKRADVLSFHVHVTPETERMVNRDWFMRMKRDVLMVNTSRGEIMDESALVAFLKQNPCARYAADVVSEETRAPGKSLVLKAAQDTDQILITPHMGGMTHDARRIAYLHAARLLENYFVSQSQKHPQTAKGD